MSEEAWVISGTLCQTLVGRDTELRRLESAFEAARGASGHLCVLRGEVGMGKSRLASELRLLVERQGAVVLEGACAPEDLQVPYLPFLQAIGSYFSREVPTALPPRIGRLRRELAPLFPAVLADIESASADDVGGVPDKLRVFDAIASLLTAICESHGSLVILEDLHWADASTIELLTYLVHRVRRSSVMLLGTYRLDELGPGSSLNLMVNGWARAGVCEVVDLHALGRGEVADFIGRVIGRSVLLDEAVEALYTRSGGNPFVLEEMLKEVMEQDPAQLALHAGGRHLREIRLPGTVREVIRSRLHRLDPEHREILRCASVLGTAFDYPALVSISGREERSVRSAVRRAIELQILTDEGESGRFRFRHALTRDAIYDDMMALDRMRLHGAAADVIAGRKSVSVELCWHLLAAGRPTRAIPVALQAAADAERVYAYAEAARLYERVLPHVAESPERGRVLCRLGDARRASGDPTGAQSSLETGVEILEGAGLLEEAAGGLLSLATCLWERSQFDLTAQACQRACRMLEPLGPNPVLVHAYLRLAGLRNLSYEADAAIAMARQAERMAAHVDSLELRMEAATCLGVSLSYKGHYDEGLDHLDRTVRQGLESKLIPPTLVALHNATIMRMYDFRVAEAWRFLGQLRDVATKAWSRREVKIFEGMLLLWADGKPAKAADSFEQALVEARAGGTTVWVEWIEANLAVAYAELDRGREALRLLPQTTINDYQQRRLETLCLLRATLVAGDLDAAARFARSAAAVADTPVCTRGWLRDAIVENLLAGGDVDGAAELAAAWDWQPEVKSEEAFRLRIAGRIAVGRGRPDQAIEPMRAACELWSSRSAGYEASRTRLALANALVLAGERASAKDELRRALVDSRERGALAAERLARRRLVELGVAVTATEQMVRDALEVLNRPALLVRSPLMGASQLHRAAPSSGGDALRDLLAKTIRQLRTSGSRQEAEAGMVLEACYVKGRSAHEAVAEGLQLSRPTYFRRLRLGLKLVAERLGTLDDVVIN